MELVVIGQVCIVNDVDWVIICVISDLVGGQEGVNVEYIYDKEVFCVGVNVFFVVMDELVKVN